MGLRILGLWHETVKPIAKLIAKQPIGYWPFRKIADL